MKKSELRNIIKEEIDIENKVLLNIGTMAKLLNEIKSILGDDFNEENVFSMVSGYAKKINK